MINYLVVFGVLFMRWMLGAYLVPGGLLYHLVLSWSLHRPYLDPWSGVQPSGLRGPPLGVEMGRHVVFQAREYFEGSSIVYQRRAETFVIGFLISARRLWVHSALTLPTLCPCLIMNLFDQEIYNQKMSSISNVTGYPLNKSLLIEDTNSMARKHIEQARP